MRACNRWFALLVTLAGSAAAQSPAEEPQPALLAGPSVAETNITAPNSNFVQPENQRRRLAGAMDAPLLREFLAELRESADPNLHLTPEQQQEIAAITRDHQARMNEFERSHARELRLLRGQADQAGPRARPGQPGARQTPDESAAMGEMNADAFTRLAELEHIRPDPADLHKRMRAVLNEHQREALDQRIEATLRERIEQRQMEQIRKEVADQMARQTPAQINLDRLPPRMRQRIEALTPEERAEALERLRQQFAARGAQRQESPPEKPAPNMNQVAVPRPGSG